jgi:hypothetical protein
VLKELGKLPSYLRKKRALGLGNQVGGAQTRGWRLFIKNTGLCEVCKTTYRV